MGNTYKLSQIQGQNAEKEFAILAELKGYKIKYPTPEENYKKHYDIVLIDELDIAYPIEVKSLKRIQRDGYLQEDYTWVDLHPKYGWINGESKYIAFQTFTEFIIVKRLNLIALIDDRLKQEIVKKPEEATYKLYRRKQQELLTLVPMEDIKTLQCQARWRR